MALSRIIEGIDTTANGVFGLVLINQLIYLVQTPF
jgi:hypothetical protein